LVEHLLCKQGVGGSSPLVSTDRSPGHCLRVDDAPNECGRPWTGRPLQITVEVREQLNECMELPGEHTALHGLELAGVPQAGRPFGRDGLGEDSACHRLKLARIPQRVAVGTNALR
jgi:hypothetical protein